MFDFAVDMCRLCSTTFLVLGLSLGVPLGVTLVLTPRRHRMKLIIGLLLIVTAGISTAATVTLSGGRGKCDYGTIATDAQGNLSVTCAGTVIVVDPPDVFKPKPPIDVTPPGSPMQGYAINGSLEASGRWVFHRGPRNARYLIPDVPANTVLEVTASGGYEPVKITIYGPDGQILRGIYGIPASREFIAGAGEVRGTALSAGLYQAEVEGGGELTTINHRRSSL